MLILSRKVGQRLYVGPNIVITVTEVGPGRVRLGIEAPESVAVFREEVRNRKRLAEGEPAAAVR